MPYPIPPDLSNQKDQARTTLSTNRAVELSFFRITIQLTAEFQLATPVIMLVQLIVRPSETYTQRSGNLRQQLSH